MGSTLTRDLADIGCVKAMFAHLLVCDDCAKVAMMVTQACAADVVASNQPAHAPGARIIRLARSKRKRYQRAAATAAVRNLVSPADAA